MDPVQTYLSIGIENKFTEQLALEVSYNYNVERSDNDYFRNRFLISGRFYLSDSSKIWKDVFIGPSYRYCKIKHYPDQSEIPEIFYHTRAFGINLGKIFNLYKRLSLDFSMGTYYFDPTSRRAIYSDLSVWSIGKTYGNVRWGLIVDLRLRFRIFP